MDLTKKPYRECRDNKDNPLAFPIGIILDVTGSMAKIPTAVIANLHKVIPIIRDQGNIKYPAICFSAVGDANYGYGTMGDEVPVQFGEFESDDLVMEDSLASVYLEGGGGGNTQESYELPIWFFANKVETDHWAKRGRKGILFIVCDEGLKPVVDPTELERFCGCSDVPVTTTAEAIEELLKRWEVVVIRPAGTSHYDNTSIHQEWVEHFGAQRVLKVSMDSIVATIAGIASAIAGTPIKEVKAALKASGLPSEEASTLLASVAPETSISDTAAGFVEEADPTAAGPRRL